MKTRDKILYGILAFILLLTITYTIIFCIKGAYPTEMYLALVPTCIAEFFIIYKLGIEDKKKGGQN